MVAEGQVLISVGGRELLMGEGTLYDLQSDVNPFLRSVRRPQSSPRAWAHGSTSGAEWQNEVVVPLRTIVNGADGDVRSCRVAIQSMSAAFAAVGAPGTPGEMRFILDGDDTEFLMFGTPSLTEPEMGTIGQGYVYANAAWIAADPRTYSGDLHTMATGLPVQQGGLTVPLTAPFTVNGVLVGGRATLTNSGSTATSIKVKFSIPENAELPLVEPWFVLRLPDGTVQSVHFDVTLEPGQFMEVDSTTHLALVNGLPESNQRGRATWLLQTHPLPPGDTVFRFGSGGEFNADAQATVSWRSAWM